jgi:hypothetical protein
MGLACANSLRYGKHEGSQSMWSTLGEPMSVEEFHEQTDSASLFGQPATLRA